MWSKKFLTKICPMIQSRNLRSLGGSEEPFFANLDSKPRGGTVPHPRKMTSKVFKDLRHFIKTRDNDTVVMF